MQLLAGLFIAAVLIRYRKALGRLSGESYSMPVELEYNILAGRHKNAFGLNILQKHDGGVLRIGNGVDRIGKRRVFLLAYACLRIKLQLQPCVKFFKRSESERIGDKAVKLCPVRAVGVISRLADLLYICADLSIAQAGKEALVQFFFLPALGFIIRCIVRRAAALLRRLGRCGICRSGAGLGSLNGRQLLRICGRTGRHQTDEHAHQQQNAEYFLLHRSYPP